MDLLQFSCLEYGLAGLTAVLFLILLSYCIILYALPWRKRSKQKPLSDEKVSADLPPVSVVVYAQADEVYFKQHLPALLTQDYPDFEVIVVNDGTSEACTNILSELKKEYSNLYFTFIPKEARYISKKKLALTLGIKAAKNDIVLFTEIDCQFHSPKWISSTVSSYNESTELVLGFANYPYSKGWRNRLIGYDNLKLGLQYLSAAMIGHPYSGSGKNMSYTKSLFFNNKGFYNQLFLKMGEDTQFISEVGKAENTRVNYSTEGLVQLSEIYRLKKWTQEKTGIITSRAYSNNRFYRLFLFENFCYWLFILAVIVSIGVGWVGNYLLSIFSIFLFVVYFLVKGYYYIRSSSLLQQKISVFSFLPLDIAVNIYNLYIDIVSLFRKKQNYVFLIDK